MERLGKSYAEARALSWLLQEQKKVVLAKEMAKHVDLSAAKAEMLALGSEEYEIHLNGTKEAIGEEARLRAELERWTMQFEALRSLSSLEKSKMNMV